MHSAIISGSAGKPYGMQESWISFMQESWISFMQVKHPPHSTIATVSPTYGFKLNINYARNSPGKGVIKSPVSLGANQPLLHLASRKRKGSNCSSAKLHSVTPSYSHLPSSIRLCVPRTGVWGKGERYTYKSETSKGGSCRLSNTVGKSYGSFY